MPRDGRKDAVCSLSSGRVRVPVHLRTPRGDALPSSHRRFVKPRFPREVVCFLKSASLYLDMYAALIKDNSITYGATEDPDISENDILVKVNTAGVNAADILQVLGHYPPPPGTVRDIPGLEYSGTVEKIGSKVTGFEIGDKVMGLTAGGAHAQKLAVNAGTALLLPKSLDSVEAGGFSEAFFTAYDALALKAGLSPGESLLVTGAAGGVGTAATQIGILWQCRVVASIRNEATRRRFEEHFARLKSMNSCHRDSRGSLLITFHNGATLTVTSPEGECLYQKYHVFLELLAGKHLSNDLEMSEKGARIAVIGLLESRAGDIDLSLLLRHHINIFGSTLRSRSNEEKALLSKRIGEDLLPYLVGKELSVVIDSCFPLAEFAGVPVRQIS